tara:strand:+ start:22283 stop:22555 length:273 start_codon:yes stop_codon:yes gene_type:complete
MSLMPITSSAKKAHKQSLQKRVFNTRRARAMKDTLKQINKLLTSGKKDDAQKLLPAAYKAIDKAAKRGILKQNTASRKKSRLNAQIKKAS